MTHVVHVTRDELLQRRDEILQRFHVTLEEFQQRAQNASLVGDEWEAWEELKDVAYLLGESESC
ncbi:hypothetical protein GCM10012275_46630 [Longimycelium tulufanense]|uniref:Uncharacterized protein n=1 Tax=Longimycelium tulufanense TaxID=907463 RepID=A0A8J3FYC4_9PSEU|nr:hypothetical protein [Longimycelium tulufanense]GGM70859.1 hypothetical protein GCM10012275_46630 [Longimycelium tulufanense]